MKNKIFATIVIIMMAIQALPLHILADFQVHWAEGSIELLQESNIVLGDENGNINLDNFITRAEFTAIVNRTFEFNETSDNNFIDVSPNSWYYRDFSIAKNLGFIMGDENGMANPESNIRRVEVALILARVLGLESEQLPNFTDNNEIPSWGIFAVSAMQENGLISGYQDGSFRSLSDITRAEAFTIIANIIRSREEAIEIVSTTSNFANVNTSSNNAGNSNDNSDNSQDGETTPPINSPAPPNLPPSGGNNPIIIVHTEFPSGEVTQSYIDIEYTATPSQGAVITEIFYRTNDGAEDFIYLSEASGFTPMGELGRARVFIRPDENNIVFTVRDSAGREGHFTVEATPTLSWFVEYEEDPRVIKADPEGYEFVANNLSIMVHEGVTREQVEEVIANINGRIVWMSVISNNYDINLPPHEYEDLRAIIEYLETEFSDVIRHVSINWLAFLDNQPTNDPWWNDRRFPFRSSQWGLSAIRVPEAWDFLQTQETR
ncbi:MAG: S-layer homology domain-containing protein, partial [Defluviitaleaceae bacterium]|nr:S-layer homology domain-containing protein [Defluviitaleaceae bacterium]